MLPDAVQVADPFHIVRLANQALDECRRRVQNGTRGHRGRKTDPLYRSRRLLTKGHERLDDTGEAKLRGLLEAGDPRGEVAQQERRSAGERASRTAKQSCRGQCRGCGCGCAGQRWTEQPHQHRASIFLLYGQRMPMDSGAILKREDFLFRAQQSMQLILPMQNSLSIPIRDQETAHLYPWVLRVP